MGDLFKYAAFSEPACDGQHSRVLLVSVLKKTSVSEQHAPLFPQNLITLALTLNNTILDLNHHFMSSTKYTRFAWAGGTFFPVVLLCQFLVLAGHRFWLYILRSTQSSIQVWYCVSFFWFWREIVFGVTYALSVQYSCAVMPFFCCGGKVNFVQIFLLNPNFLFVHIGNYFVSFKVDTYNFV